MRSVGDISPIVEESTIDATSILPSFLELYLVNISKVSGHKALLSIIDAIVANVSFHLQNERNHVASSGPNGESTNFLDTSCSAIKSRLKHMVSTLGHYASKLCKLYSAEITVVMLYVLELWCIQAKSATISEAVYGLRRSKLVSTRENEYGNQSRLDRLSHSDGIRLALLTSAIPYLNVKLDSWYKQELNRSYISSQPSRLDDAEIMMDESNESAALLWKKRNRVFEKWRQIIVYMYPFLRVSVTSTQLMYHALYLIRRSIYNDPWSHALGLMVRRVTMSDMKDYSIKTTVSTASKPVRNTQCNIGRAITFVSASMLFGSWLVYLRTEMLRRRRRHYLTNHEELSDDPMLCTSGTVPNSNSSKIPPPPLQHDFNITHGIPSHLCPLCYRQRLNPVTSIYGHVYCYRCIIMHIRENGEVCPLTGLLCEESQLYRIYGTTGL